MRGDQTFRLVRRGYDPAEVQSFANAVVVEISGLQDQNRALVARLKELEAAALVAPEPTVAAEPVYVEAEVDEAAVAKFLGGESLRIMTAIRGTAEDIKRSAEAAGVDKVARAEAAAVAHLAAAEAEAAEHLSVSNAEAHRTRSEADTYAADLTTQAHAAATAAHDEATAYAKQVRDQIERDALKRRGDAEAEAAQLVSDARRQRDTVLNELSARRDRVNGEIKVLMNSRRALLDALERVQMHAAEAQSIISDAAESDGVADPAPRQTPVDDLARRTSSNRQPSVLPSVRIQPQRLVDKQALTLEIRSAIDDATT